MRVILAHAYKTKPFDRYTSPLGLGYLAQVLRSRKIAEPIIWDEQCVPYKPFHITLRPLLNPAPALVGFTVYKENLARCLEIAAWVKAEVSDATVVFGGPHASLTSEDILMRYADVDIVVRGEGEDTLAELCQALSGNVELSDVKGISYRTGEHTRRNPARPLIRDLDSIQPPARDLLPKPWGEFVEPQNPSSGHAPAFTIIASRGCNRRCAFCGANTLTREQLGPLVRIRSAENILEEMMALSGHNAKAHFSFLDDNLLASPRTVQQLAERILETNRQITFSMLARVDDILNNQALLPLLHKAGCESVEIGLESGNNTVLERYGKKTTVDMNRAAVAAVRQAQMQPLADFIMWDPDVTPDELIANVRFLTELDLLTLDAAFNRLETLPGTDYYETLSCQGRLKGGLHNSDYDFVNHTVARAWERMQQLKRTYYIRIRGCQLALGRILYHHRSGAYPGNMCRLADDDIAHINELLRSLVQMPFEFLPRLLESMDAQRQVSSTSEQLLRTMTEDIVVRAEKAVVYFNAAECRSVTDARDSSTADKLT